MGSPAPSLALDTSGVAYYGVQTKINGGVYAFRIYVQALGSIPATPLETGIRGQGRLNETCGLLIASGCAETGDSRSVATFVVPGFVASGNHVATVPQAIAPDSALAILYTGAYQPADLDTPQEVALRVSKQLAAIHQLIGLLESAGVVTR